jgi:hypothetical protein
MSEKTVVLKFSWFLYKSEEERPDRRILPDPCDESQQMRIAAWPPGRGGSIAAGTAANLSLFVHIHYATIMSMGLLIG